MRRAWIGLIGAVIATVALAPNASAQTQESLSARVGAFLPTDSTLRGLEKYWLAAGIDARMNTKFLRNADTLISVDVMTKDFGKTSANVFPITLNEIFYSPCGTERMYFGAGYGPFLADVGSRSRSVMGGRLILGLELNTDWFVEADYFFSDTISGETGAKANGLGLYVGMRF